MAKPQKAKEVKTMAKSSANIQKMSAGAFSHNDRSAKNPSYIIGIDDGQKNECDRTAAEAKKMADDLYKNAVENYDNKKGGRVASKKNSMSEIVVNLNRDHTLADVQRLATEFEKEYGWTAVQLSVHKDEGHLANNGVTHIYNNHAHMCFFTLDQQTGKQLHNLGSKLNRRGEVYAVKTDTVKMQDITAEVLGMQRGDRGSKAKRLNAKQYRAVAKQSDQVKKEFREKLNLELERLKREYMRDRQDLINSGQATQKDYMDLKKNYEKISAAAVEQVELRNELGLPTKENTPQDNNTTQEQKQENYPMPNTGSTKENALNRKYEPRVFEKDDQKEKSRQNEETERLRRKQLQEDNELGIPIEENTPQDNDTTQEQKQENYPMPNTGSTKENALNRKYEPRVFEKDDQKEKSRQNEKIESLRRKWLQEAEQRRSMQQNTTKKAAADPNYHPTAAAVEKMNMQMGTLGTPTKENTPQTNDTTQEQKRQQEQNRQNEETERLRRKKLKEEDEKLRKKEKADPNNPTAPAMKP